MSRVSRACPCSRYVHDMFMFTVHSLFKWPPDSLTQLARQQPDSPSQLARQQPDSPSQLARQPKPFSSKPGFRPRGSENLSLRLLGHLYPFVATGHQMGGRVPPDPPSKPISRTGYQPGDPIPGSTSAETRHLWPLACGLELEHVML